MTPAKGHSRRTADPMGTNIVHKLLVNSQRIQRIPPPLLLLIMLALSGLAGLGWAKSGRDAFVASAGLALGFSLIDWLALWLLPRVGRSFGPERPPALALATLRALVAVLLGLLGLPLAAAAVGHALLTALALYATWLEPFRLGVTRQGYRFSGWPAAAPPLRLLHLGDLHLERTGPRERRLNQLIADLTPDLIVFSGDFVNISYAEDPQTEAAIRALISQWQAPLGVYCVRGTYTVEPVDRVRAFVNGLENLRLLEDEWVTIDAPGGPLHLLGMTTTHKLAQDRQTVARLAAQAPGDGLRLLLTHAPDVAPEADAAGYHLYLCGHTHGGQLRLPLIGAVFTGSALGRRFAMGRYDLDTVTVYTSRGIGLEGLGAPRARFLCPPEIILWQVQGSG